MAASTTPATSGAASGLSIDHASIYKECFESRDKFLETANQYLKKSGHPTLDLATSNSWTDVEASVGQACQVLEKMTVDDKAAKGFTGRLRKAYRALCRNTHSLSALVDQIPSDFMLSPVLRGGLKVIFLAMEHAGYHRRAVYDAMEEIPLALKDNAAYLDIFVDDEELHGRMAAFYVALILILRHILRWFLKNNFKAGIKNLVLPKAADDKLKERMADMKLRAKQFNQRALICSQFRQEEALKLLRTAAGMQKRATLLQKEGFAVQSDMHQDVKHIKGQLKDVKTQLERLACLQNVVAKFESTGIVVLRSKPSHAPKNVDTPKPHASFPAAPTTSPITTGLTTSSVLSQFQFEPALLPTDLAAVLHSPPGPTPFSPDRIASIIQHVQLRVFLTTDTPSALLINTHGNPIPRSDSSLVSARLVSSLLAATTTEQLKATIVTAAFFCGEHRPIARDVHAAPAEAAMSLLLQVVAGWGRFDAAELEWIRGNLDPTNTRRICAVFEGVVQRLPAVVVVFVVVDGLDFFSEPPERVTEMTEVIRMLVKLSRDGNGVRARIKVLFVGATRARFVEEEMRETEVLDIPRFCPPAGDPGAVLGMGPGQVGQGPSGIGMLEY